MYFPGTTRAYELWQAHSVLNVNTQTSLAYSLLAVSVGPQGTQVAIEGRFWRDISYILH
jgi:hypothetical protein